MAAADFQCQSIATPLASWGASIDVARIGPGGVGERPHPRFSEAPVPFKPRRSPSSHPQAAAPGDELALRQTEGLIGSILQLLRLDLAVPDHSTLSRRAETLEVPCPRSSPGSGPVRLLVDSTGLRLCGPGEWLALKHGSRTRRSWKKLHLATESCSRRGQAFRHDRAQDAAAAVRRAARVPCRRRSRTVPGRGPEPRGDGIGDQSSGAPSRGLPAHRVVRPVRARREADGRGSALPRADRPGDPPDPVGHRSHAPPDWTQRGAPDPAALTRSDLADPAARRLRARAPGHRPAAGSRPPGWST